MYFSTDMASNNVINEDKVHLYWYRQRHCVRSNCTSQCTSVQGNPVLFSYTNLTYIYDNYTLVRMYILASLRGLKREQYVTVGVFLLLGGIDPDRVSLYCFGEEKQEKNGTEWHGMAEMDVYIDPRLV